MTKPGPLFPEDAQRFLAVGGFPNFQLSFRRQQSPQSVPHDGMIFDDEDLHESAACAEVGTLLRSRR